MPTDLILAAALAAATVAGSALTADPRDRDVSSPALTTGGLTLSGAPMIETVSEDLAISEQSIVARYRLRNPSNGAVTAKASFALPTMTLAAIEDSTPSIPDADSANFLDAAVSVNGSPVRPRIEQRAFVRGVERTDVLRALKIPLDGYSDADPVIAAVDRLDATQKARLKSLGLIYSGLDELRAAWDLRTALVWTQAIAAGATVEIDLRYSPSVGFSPHPNCCAEGWAGPADIARERRRYCAGADVVAAVQRQGDPGDVAEAHFSEAYVNFALATAAGGTIGDFHLTVDKSDEQDLVSFCGQAVVKTGPTRFEMRAKNYPAGRDLAVLFLDYEPSNLVGTP